MLPSIEEKIVYVAILFLSYISIQSIFFRPIFSILQSDPNVTLEFTLYNIMAESDLGYVFWIMMIGVVLVILPAVFFEWVTVTQYNAIALTGALGIFAVINQVSFALRYFHHVVRFTRQITLHSWNQIDLFVIFLPLAVIFFLGNHLLAKKEKVAVIIDFQETDFRGFKRPFVELHHNIYYWGGIGVFAIMALYCIFKPFFTLYYVQSTSPFVVIYDRVYPFELPSTVFIVIVSISILNFAAIWIWIFLLKLNRGVYLLVSGLSIFIISFLTQLLDQIQPPYEEYTSVVPVRNYVANGIGSDYNNGTLILPFLILFFIVGNFLTRMHDQWEHIKNIQNDFDLEREDLLLYPNDFSA